MLHSTIAADCGETLLAAPPAGDRPRTRVVEEAHWDGLPTGKGRRTTTGEVLAVNVHWARRPDLCRRC
nr:hypothetical protein StreXyl84_63370 [Streptomyces sp. Xyl84]